MQVFKPEWPVRTGFFGTDYNNVCWEHTQVKMTDDKGCINIVSDREKRRSILTYRFLREKLEADLEYAPYKVKVQMDPAIPGDLFAVEFDFGCRKEKYEEAVRDINAAIEKNQTAEEKFEAKKKGRPLGSTKARRTGVPIKNDDDDEYETRKKPERGNAQKKGKPRRRRSSEEDDEGYSNDGSDYEDYNNNDDDFEKELNPYSKKKLQVGRQKAATKSSRVEDFDDYSPPRSLKRVKTEPPEAHSSSRIMRARTDDQDLHLPMLREQTRQAGGLFDRNIDRMDISETTLTNCIINESSVTFCHISNCVVEHSKLNKCTITSNPRHNEL